MRRDYRNPIAMLPYFKNCVLCCECASGILGLSTYDYSYLNFFYILPKSFDSSMKTFAYYIYNVDKVDYNNVELIEIDGVPLYITNEERTIMDMIKYECDDKMILQSLDEYTDRHNNDLSELYKLADGYGLREELDILIKDIPMLYE